PGCSLSAATTSSLGSATPAFTSTGARRSRSIGGETISPMPRITRRRGSSQTGTSAPVVRFFFHAEDGIRALYVTGVQTCALPILTITSDVSLAVTKTFSPSTVIAGDGNHTFTIAAKNTGTSSTAHAVVVTDTVDPRLIVTAVSGGPGSTCAAVSQSISCSYATLAA